MKIPESHACVAATLALALVGCGGSDASVGGTSDALVGTWAKTEVNGAMTTDTYLVVNADKTHRWLGKTVQTNGSVTMTTDGPCGAGTYAFSEATLTMTTDYVSYGSGPNPTKSTQTKSETFRVELVDDSLRLNQSVIFKKANPPSGTFCP